MQPPARPPSPDHERQKASVAQLNGLAEQFQGAMDNLTERATASITQLHQNDMELEAGISSSEFNLRAHQKAINDLALDMDIILKIVAAINKKIDPESEWPGVLSHVALADVPIPQEDGSKKTYRRVNWAQYHARVENDLKILKEAEKKAKEEAEAAEAAPPQEDGSIPEGATVFGGDKK